MNRLRVTYLPLLIVLALCLPGWWMTNTDAPDLAARLYAPSSTHLAGTDHLGRDVMARTLRATSLAAATALPAWLLATLFGGFVGLVGAILHRRAAGAIIRGAIQVMFSIPFVIVLVGLGIVFGRGPLTVFWIIVLVCWAAPARLAYALARNTLAAPFISTARAVGYGPMQIGLYALAPTCVRPIIIASGGLLAEVMAIDAALTLFGLGPTPPSPTMGSLISDGLRFISTAPWMAVAPLGSLCLVCLCLRWLLHEQRG